MSVPHQHEQLLELPPHSSDPEQELPRVLRALQTVYAAGGPASTNDPFDKRDLADRYLTSFQRTAVAWVVSMRLLSPSDGEQGGSTTAQCQFFAAQTLHAKCIFGDVHQVADQVRNARLCCHESSLCGRRLGSTRYISDDLTAI